MGIARTFGLSASQVSKQLTKFESAGVLVSRSIGKTRVYYWNERNPLVGDVRRVLQNALERLPERRDSTVLPRANAAPTSQGKVDVSPIRSDTSPIELAAIVSEALEAAGISARCCREGRLSPSTPTTDISHQDLDLVRPARASSTTSDGLRSARFSKKVMIEYFRHPKSGFYVEFFLLGLPQWGGTIITEWDAAGDCLWTPRPLTGTLRDASPEGRLGATR